MNSIHETLQRFDVRHEIAEKLLGDIAWDSSEAGFCTCPGADTHTTNAGPKDCRVSIDGTPTIHCFHQSCAEHLLKANQELRDATTREELLMCLGGSRPHVRSRAQQRIIDSRREAEQEALANARSALPKIIHDFAWIESEAGAESPVPIELQPVSHAKLFLREMFSPDQIVWIGGKFDSGKPEHVSHFQPVSKWLDCKRISGPFTCASTFKPGVIARRNDNVDFRPYIVLEGDVVDAGCAAKTAAREPLEESDKLRNRAACLAVLNWIRSKTPLVLRAVVDAANKSMHGWFDMPDAATMAELKIILPGLGFDKSVLRPSQPVRLPGVLRPESDKWQRLIYLNPSNFWK